MYEITPTSLHATQLPILLIGQVNILAPSGPRSDGMVEPRQRGVFGMAPLDKAPEVVQGRELEIASPGADAGAAVVLNEVDSPSIAVIGS